MIKRTINIDVYMFDPKNCKLIHSIKPQQFYGKNINDIAKQITELKIQQSFMLQDLTEKIGLEKFQSILMEETKQ